MLKEHLLIYIGLLNNIVQNLDTKSCIKVHNHRSVTNVTHSIRNLQHVRNSYTISSANLFPIFSSAFFVFFFFFRKSRFNFSKWATRLLADFDVFKVTHNKLSFVSVISLCQSRVTKFFLFFPRVLILLILWLCIGSGFCGPPVHCYSQACTQMPTQGVCINPVIQYWKCVAILWLKYE